MPIVEVDTAIAGAIAVIDRHGTDRSGLIHVLQDIQEEFGYLPQAALRRVSTLMKLPLPEVLRVATFYSALSLEPRGTHLISVCTGTACHIKGTARILDALRRNLHLKEGRETTDDWRFTVTDVRCLGCCGLAPVINIDGQTYGRLMPDRLPEILANYE